ncbi:MAG TPA: hypothetical protein VLM38_14125 [Blastocatellia bacterium]|nr:hypothetical protein [Blastocatellia bacterium]
MSTSSRKRLRFDRAEVNRDGSQCRVRVTFTLGEEIVRTEATDSMDGSGPLKAAAVATLKAVQESAASRFTCSLSDLDHVSALGKSLIAVLVDVNFQGRDQQVFGSCQIAGAETDCAVKAALNAVNRIFELAMRDS